MSSAFDAIVIGAGSNGLTAAAALGRAGLSVLVVERAESVGGQAAPIEFAPGYRATLSDFDAGWLPPSVAHGLGIDDFEERERAHPDIPLTVVVEPGEVLALSNAVADAAGEIRRYSAGDAARWPAFTADLHAFAGFLETLYQAPPPAMGMRGDTGFTRLLGIARRFRRLGRDRMTGLLRTLPMPVHDLVEDWFECAPLAAAVAAGGVTDNRHGPRSGGTAFVLLHYLAGARPGCIRGRGYWRSGPGALIAALETVARGTGVTVRTASPVASILVHDDAVSGVVLQSGEEIRAPRVLSTADPARTLLGMVDPVWLDPEFLLNVRNVRFRGCASMVCFALDELPTIRGLDANVADRALAGVVSLTPELDTLQRAADAAKYRTVAERLHVEITVPTLRWPAMAPDGTHVLVARAQYTPHELQPGDSWDVARRDALADAVTAHIETALPGFATRIRDRAALTPADFEERSGLTEGALTHGELALDQVLFMRPIPGWSHYAMPIGGLYLGGAGTHPGPGIRGGPGWLAARRLLADRKARRSAGSGARAPESTLSG